MKRRTSVTAASSSLVRSQVGRREISRRAVPVADDRLLYISNTLLQFQTGSCYPNGDGMPMDARELELVVLIADLSGYTALTEAHGNMQAATVVTRY
jgi:class 3 adenylate cyclase